MWGLNLVAALGELGKDVRVEEGCSLLGLNVSSVLLSEVIC